MIATRAYNELAESYHAKTQRHFYNSLLEKPAMMKALSRIKFKNKRVLDLGCGSGRYSAILARRGAIVHGIDPSVNMLEIAKREVPRAKFEVGDSYSIPFKNSHFDAVVAALSIEYSASLEKAFNEVNRSLKKGGHFIFSIRNPVSEVAISQKNGLSKFDGYFREGKRTRRWPSFGIDMPFYHFTMETYMKSLVKCGFEITDWIDARPAAAAKKLFPEEYAKAMDKPYFSVVSARKR